MKLNQSIQLLFCLRLKSPVHLHSLPPSSLSFPFGRLILSICWCSGVCRENRFTHQRLIIVRCFLWRCHSGGDRRGPLPSGPGKWSPLAVWSCIREAPGVCDGEGVSPIGASGERSLAPTTTDQPLAASGWCEMEELRWRNTRRSILLLEPVPCFHSPAFRIRRGHRSSLRSLVACHLQCTCCFPKTFESFLVNRKSSIINSEAENYSDKQK